MSNTNTFAAEILMRYGTPYSMELKLRTLGLCQNESADYLVNETKLPITIDEFVNERNKMAFDRFPSAKLLPGAMRLIKHLKNYNIPISIATSSSRKSYIFKSKNHVNFFDMFDHITCGDDADIIKCKPSPDLFLSSWKKMGCPPKDRCLVFEDSNNGIIAAKKAGMQAVLISSNYELMESIPLEDIANLEIISSLTLFEPKKYGLPSFN